MLKDLHILVSEKNQNIPCGYIFYTDGHGGSSVLAHMRT